MDNPHIPSADSLAVALTAAIHSGDIESLRQLLRDHPPLANVRVVDEKGIGRTPLHIATDWPGHFPNCGQGIAVLIAAGADPDAGVAGTPKHTEAPLHWAASSDDVEALDALLDGGANIEQPGAIFTNGAAMSDAVIFANWNAAGRLLARGAKTTITQSAALGLQDRLEVFFADAPPPLREITAALWHACRGGQRETAAYLLAHGADLNWIGWDHLRPLDCAGKSGNASLVEWLQSQGAKSARDL